MRKFFPFIAIVIIGVIGAVTFSAYRYCQNVIHEKKILKKIITRLEADSRIAEVVVTDVRFHPTENKTATTIKFLEYNTDGKPLKPKYFTFFGNLIQFQSLVVRFDDDLIRNADGLRGKSAYLFWKAFVLDGPKTQEYPVALMNTIPSGYKLEGEGTNFETGFWKKFWDYALNKKAAQRYGIKNAQIEAPGTKFVPGILYTLKIEHDGGIRIDTSEIPSILKGETIPLK